MLFTTAYAPAALLQSWMHTVADINPVAHVIEGARQGFVGAITSAATWPAFAALASLDRPVLGILALRELENIAA